MAVAEKKEKKNEAHFCPKNPNFESNLRYFLEKKNNQGQLFAKGKKTFSDEYQKFSTKKKKKKKVEIFLRNIF